jgi:cobalamin biosynthesis protein CbiG
MVVGEAVMNVAGIGCRRGVASGEVEAAIAAALASTGHPRLDALATGEAKRQEPAIAAAAFRLGLPLLHPAMPDMADAAPGTLTRSARVEVLFGIPSLAEAAALAAAGPGARLLGPRLAVGRVTCAIAVAEPP